ncbi:CTP synthase [Zymomonas mobilis subsp. mobilis ZM4 = ATCC 31821]|uniref:CTP synthase n=2 Tax=Zymomonas mobilis subsp. mobilis TaxID=120045 RepID=PYRG_ZYMMO|nr:CTP synthase [Zymomonas mobilis]Q5NQB9.1 RecName: Full=CTP synthase; AltName: Full=Cytidine 5'-triphosphate synthase; AltName: Full=Cytidine triphosphate synthetase; Short=CTP synthetase; Short=CTPS; AltName: Full=UTP--ammonia ligase [Zymomonas mobilis subsp. mobilis ZM4 = ATCC 31821]AAV89086.1 CTP synthase [Zymomonas mobilis subsp. mobilis ZM4 = ATCC 31821]ACV75336.1 CTP synthase [Zymomonas mobilis subsp. mobilis NCIMB 11163]AEH62827.1 CTP synthase [Zymomonas mobilis subsp. mobilis ATCC 109
MARFIFITGGVVSSLGKGLMAASLAALLQERGFRVRIRKFDPYLNVDPGTMSPYQHGEVYVTDDGAETDLDLGHYERFSGVPSRRSDNITSGRIYQNIIAKERRGDYLGATVQVIPHVTDAIKDFARDDTDDLDFVLCEIGGTVGDIESLPFIEAIRQLKNDLGRGNVVFVHLTLVPYIAAAGELKTKPTQHSVRDLTSFGIQPDVLVCRTEHPLPDSERSKIALFCNVPKEAVIPALDAKSIYDVPLHYHAEGLDKAVLSAFGLNIETPLDLHRWKEISDRLANPEGEVTIGVVGKYVGLQDAYKSLHEALVHGGIANRVKVNIVWLDAEMFEGNNPEAAEALSSLHAILVPGGFGERGSEGKIAAVKFAREHKVPFFGICLGMQMACIEGARNTAGLKKASSSEFGPSEEPVIGLITEWERDGEREERAADGDLGGTMRLGAYPAVLKAGSQVAEIYNSREITERHRHRYEVNIHYKEPLEKGGLVFSGMSPDGLLPEIVERPDHPWFIGVQFHPELKSKPFDPHPLFSDFVAAALKQSRLV